MIGILTDITKCIGCNECVAACKRTYGLDADVPRRWQKPDGLSAANWTAVLRLPDKRYVRKQCMHCIEPACVSVCLVGALQKTPEGPVVYDSAKCIGCRYCILSCPFGVPRYDWGERVPYVRKCILCYERVKDGQKPACVEACPTQATIFGDREHLLEEAKRRIAADPGKYQPCVYGETEFGGTCVMYLSDVDLSFLSYGKRAGDRALPPTTEDVLKWVPVESAAVGLALGGLCWFFHRRNAGLRGELEAGEERE